MAMKAVLGTLVIVLGCTMVAARTLGGADDFDYFVMAVRWPGTFCLNADSCCQSKQLGNFTIHGLWPERLDGTWPSCCDVNAHPFDPKEVEDLQPQLDLNWPSLYCKLSNSCGTGESPSFLQYEWESHGTCSIPALADVHAYFSAALALKNSVHVLGTLKMAGIVPSEDASYTYQQIKYAIAADVGAFPHIECMDGKLDEVWFCLRKPDADNEFQVLDCPQSESQTCPTGQPISIPTVASRENVIQMTTAV